jgi:hypothetical protein
MKLLMHLSVTSIVTYVLLAFSACNSLVSLFLLRAGIRIYKKAINSRRNAELEAHHQSGKWKVGQQ